MMRSSADCAPVGTSSVPVMTATVFPSCTQDSTCIANSLLALWDKKTPLSWTRAFLLAAEEGFEPSQTESESGVLPVHNSATNKLYYTDIFGFVNPLVAYFSPEEKYFFRPCPRARAGPEKRAQRSRIFPSIEIVTTCHGRNFPLARSASRAACSSPPQHGTSMRTMVTL